MTDFTLQILILGLPGIICYFLCRKLIGKSQRSTVEIVLIVFVYSVLSYILAGFCDVAINAYLGLGFKVKSDFFNIVVGRKRDITGTELAEVACAGALLAYLLSYCVHFNVVNLIGQWIYATKRYGDEDVWQYFHNTPDNEKNKGWLIVRDMKADLAYHCYISVWSDSGMDRELVLSDVSVYSNSTGEYLYDVKHVYLSRNKDDLMIEVPPPNAENLPAYTVGAKQKEVSDGQQETVDRRDSEKGRNKQASTSTQATN
jgi:hypothetical protein